MTFDLVGPTDAPVLVFLHAASHTRKMWLPQVQALQADFRVLTLDLPAHGVLADRPFTFDAAVRQVREVMAAAGVGRAMLVGVSLGGCVAMQFAAAHPERVAGLVLSGATFDAHRALSRLVLTGEGVVFPRGATFFTQAFHADIGRRFPDLAAEMIAAGTHWPGAAQAVRAMRGVDFAASLALYPGPTLILNGARDWVHRTAEKSFARRAQQASVQVIPGAGHLASLDQPELFTKAIRAFAAKIYAISSPAMI